MCHDMVLRNQFHLCTWGHSRLWPLYTYQGWFWWHLLSWWALLAVSCAALSFLLVWHAGPTDVLGNSDILLKDWEVSGCYYQLHGGFALLADQWCAGIALHDQQVLYRGRCIFTSCPALVVWWNASRSPRCARPCSLGGASYHDRKYQPCSSWMLAAVSCE